MRDVTSMSCVVTHNWSWEDLIASKHLMVTGRWREEENAQTLWQQDQGVYGALGTLRMWRGTVPRRLCGWGELRCGGETTKPAGEKRPSKQLGFDQEYDDKEGREKDYFSKLMDSYS